MAAATGPYDITGEIDTIGRLHMRPLQFALHNSWDQSAGHPFTLVVVTPEVLSALQWWAQPSHLLQRVPLCTPLPDIQLFTNASAEE